MTVGHAARRWATVALIGLSVAACGTPATPIAASTAPTTTPASTGTLPDPTVPVIDVTDLPGSMAAAEVAMRQEDRERAGLVDLGPGAIDLAAAMDASAGRALTRARTDAATAAGSLTGQIAGVGLIAAPEPGFNAMIVWALLISSLDDFAKGQAENGTIESKPETIEIAGNTGTITTTLTLQAVTSGSRLSVDITIKGTCGREQAPDRPRPPETNRPGGTRSHEPGCQGL